MVTVPHIMVGLERMLDYRGFGLERFHCMNVCMLMLPICFQVSGSGVHTVGMLLSVLEKAAFSFDGDELNTGRLSDGIESVTRMDDLNNIGTYNTRMFSI